MTLTSIEAMLVSGAEECRRRAMEGLDRHGDAIIIAQDLASAAESYAEAAKALTQRVRREQKATVARG